MDNTVGRQFCVSKIQGEIINGCILGDGSLECRSIKGSSRLRIHHGWKQKRFVFWKYRMLKNLVSNPPKKIFCQNTNNEGYYSWYFHTRTIPQLKNFHKLFYSKKRKVLPVNIIDLLSPMSLAVWIMDDGCNTGRSLLLNTQNFSRKEHLRLQKVFKIKFNLLCTLNRDRDKLRLRFNAKNAAKLINIVSAKIIPSMRYKIVPVETESVKTR